VTSSTHRALLVSATALALVFPFVACSVHADLVATRDVGDGGPPADDASGDSPPVDPCSAAYGFAGVGDDGLVVRVDPSESQTAEARVTVLGQPTCALGATRAVALDRAGELWIVGDQGVGIVDLTTGGAACRKSDLALPATTAIGFAGVPEILYALADGVLVAINEATLARTPIGPFKLPGLKTFFGNTAGQLYAAASSGTSITIARVHLADATMEATWTLSPPPEPAPTFLAAGVRGSDFELLFEGFVERFLPASGTQTDRASLVYPAPHAFAFGSASVCGSK
jgi:hypothetical protein